jgi:hypothetical protein|tara:strand:+ start:1586 stop:1765 length:180 start_codon:yes stop_codon:yes gene_type:complete
MGKAEKLKREHIKKVNELLDKGHKNNELKEENIILKPSDNVTKSPKSFLDKMNLLNNVG